MRNPNYDNETESGIVTAVNADGSVAVKPDGCSVSRNPVPVEDGVCFVGERVTVGFYYRDRNLPFVKSKGRTGIRKRNPATSSLNWHSWKAALYRGAYNGTNILPDLSKSETTLYEYPNAVPAPPAFGATKIHNGYVYGTEYYGNNDHRLIRISLADGAKTYATWTGDTISATPKDLMLTEEDDVLYAYFAFQGGYGGYGLYWGKYNLTTMARTYYNSMTFFNANRTVHWRLFCDNTYFYLIYYDGAWEKYEYILKFNKSTGAYVSTSNISWPAWDYQDNDYGYLCYTSEIRASIEPRGNSEIVFPTYGNQSSSGIIYEVPAIRLSDGGQEWVYTPDSKQITRQYQAQLLYWYCSYMGFYGKSFEQTYTTANLFYYFPDMDTGDKQIRSTLIACNDTLAVVMSEETTISYNKDLEDPWYGYDDWQQTVWAAVDYPTYAQLIRRYVEDGQGAPLSSHPDLIALRNFLMAPFESLEFDETPLNFSWISKKEVNLVILDITTGEVLRTITGGSYLEDSAVSEDHFVVPKANLIEDIRVASHVIEVSRTKDSMTPYEGPGFTEFMGIGDNEEPRNTTQIAQIDFWVPEFDPEKPYSYYWFGAYIINEPSGGYIKYDPIAVEFDGDSLNLQNYGPWNDPPYMGGRWEYQCVVVKHPAEDVVFPMKKYIPTQYDWSKSLITDTYLFVAPAADSSGKMGCFKIASPASHKWDLDVGPGSEMLHWCCNKTRVYYWRGTVRTNCTLYEISILTGEIITTKTGQTVNSATDGHFEPMIIDSKLVITDNKTLSYYGS